MNIRIFCALTLMAIGASGPTLAASSSQDARKMSFTELFKASASGEVAKASISDEDQTVKVELKDGQVAYVIAPRGTSAWIVDLMKTGVDVRMEHGKVTPPTGTEWMGDLARANSILDAVVGVLLPLVIVGSILWMIGLTRKKGGVGKF